MYKGLEFKGDEALQKAVQEIEELLQGEYGLSKRAIALLLLQEDEDITQQVLLKEKGAMEKILPIIQKTKEAYDKPLNYVLSMLRMRKAKEVTEGFITHRDSSKRTLGDQLSRLTTHPLLGIPIMLLVLYFGLYKFVGGFGAGTLVDLLETNVFEAYINPWINQVVDTYIPWLWLQELLARDYGIITLGLRYAIAIIMPIVTTFFLVFALIEDSGYLPRLALLIDRVFKTIGLSGRAVIPMTLGFGCTTMATMVTRTLETRRERIITTLLLALAIPCSAQLGVILALLSEVPQALFIWGGVMTLLFLLIGYLTDKAMPGQKASFYIEVPPLRWPKLTNVLVKTYTRLHWYLIEIIPLFLIASVIIWVGNLTGLFGMAVDLLKPVVTALGLPVEAAQTFLFGFFRRDYGAAGLYDLQMSGVLSPRQLVVASVTLTLFVPCVAQFVMMVKERGVKTAFAIGGFIFPFAFFCGYLLNRILSALGVLA